MRPIKITNKLLSPVEEPIYIRVKEDGDGEISIHLTDRGGKLLVRGGLLLSLAPDGVRLYPNCPEDSGFELDENGRLKVLGC